MSVSVTITNLAATPTPLSELYVVLDAAGGANEAITVERSVAQLDSMNGLKALVDAGTVSVSPVQASSNVDLISVPLEQHGVETGLSVNAVTEVTAAVVYPEPFPTGVKPVIMLTVDKENGPASRSVAYANNITNTGFDIELDVTTVDTGLTVDVMWSATY